jgi:hypothetical protein
MAKIHLQDVIDVVESGEMYGFCIACGRMADGVEPDARRYDCDYCEKPKVYGAEELLFMMGARA